MATAVIVDIAEKIKDALNAGTFSVTFTAERSYAQWEEQLEDLDTLRVDVVPLQAGPATNIETRSEVEYLAEIDIGVRKRFGRSEQEAETGRVDSTEIDDLVLLVQEIAEFFTTDRLTDTNTGIWQTTEIKQSWSRKHLREMRQFFGFVRLTFRVTKTF